MDQLTETTEIPYETVETQGRSIEEMLNLARNHAQNAGSNNQPYISFMNTTLQGIQNTMSARGIRDPELEQRIDAIRMSGYKNAICACMSSLDGNLSNISSPNKESLIGALQRAVGYLDTLFDLLRKGKDEYYVARWEALKETPPEIMKGTKEMIYQRLKELKIFYKDMLYGEQLCLPLPRIEKEENI